MSKNDEADFWFSRRLDGKDADGQDYDWFTLVGCVANGVLTKDAVRHQFCAIREGCEIQPERAGYFYAFANDAWKMYGNNHGSVRLKITRIQ